MKIEELEDDLKIQEESALNYSGVSKKTIESLEFKLSTLLKASEGMEKALEFTLGNLHPYEYPTTVEQVEKALADFRALKETK